MAINVGRTKETQGQGAEDFHGGRGWEQGEKRKIKQAEEKMTPLLFLQSAWVAQATSLWFSLGH